MYTFRVLNIRQLCIFIPISILLVLYGCNVGWVASSFVYLQDPQSHIRLSRSEAALIPALFEIGRTVSAIPAGMLGDKIGRKGVIYLCILQHTAAWLLKVFTNSKLLLFLARIICGTAVGTGNAVLFIYAGEIAPAKIRGTILSSLFTCYYFGILVQFTLGVFLDYYGVCIATLSLCALFFTFSFFIKESPSYLLSKSRDTEAKEIFNWLHEGSPRDQLDKEFDSMKEYVHNESANKTSMYSGFSDPVNRKSVGLVFAINFLTQLTGLPAVVNFARVVFQDVQVLSPGKFAVIFAAAQFLAGCFATFSADILGRRKMYMLTSILSGLAHIFTASLYLLTNQFGIDVPHVHWILLMSVSFYACVYASGLGPLTVIVRGELLPHSVKGIGSGLAVVSAGISCFILVYTFNFIEQYVGLAYNFIFFTINCSLLLVLVYLKLPETKQKTLVEIQEMFHKK